MTRNATALTISDMTIVKRIVGSKYCAASEAKSTARSYSMRSFMPDGAKRYTGPAAEMVGGPWMATTFDLQRDVLRQYATLLRVAALAASAVFAGSTLAQSASSEMLERGRHLVVIGHCNNCHTAGYA